MRYDYQCEANGTVIEVEHKLSETVSTWAELCRIANIPLGDTPGETPVQRLITGGTFIGGKLSLAPCSGPACASHVHSGGCCGGGGSCGWNN